jgi:TP901 family phage tail tape measure protein
MPPVVLTILVDANQGLVELKSFDKAVQDTTKSTQQTGQAQGQAAKQTQDYSQSLGASAKSALQFAGALTGVQLGISTIGSVVASTASSVLDFSAAMANVNTIAGRSREVQEQLRQEVLQLPPALLSSTEAAKGLYDVISAGIEPTKAVAFLGEAAKLAKAGLADMGTTVEALTKSMTAYNIPAEKANQVSDILFKTVELGQGTLSQFAHALPQVTQLSASLGVSFVDTNAIMATLSQTFRSADTAATGYRSLLVQLIQNSDKFAAVGVNIQQVIGEQGFTGVLRVLQDLTGGNSEQMKQYVNDVEGLSAAIALTGPQYKLLLENQHKYGDSLGVTERAVKLQTETTKASLGALTNAFTTYVTAAVGANDSTSVFTRVLKAYTEGLQAHTRAVLAAEERQAAWRKEQERGRTATEAQTKAVDERAAADRASLKAFADVTFAYLKEGQEAKATALATAQLEEQYRTAASEADNMALSLSGLDTSLTKNGVVTTAASRTTQELQTAIAGLNKAIKDIKPGETPTLIDQAQLEKEVTASIQSLERLRDSGRVSFHELAAEADAFRSAVLERFGAVPDAVERIVTSIKDKVRASDLQGVFDRLGFESRAALQRHLLEQVQDFQAAVDAQHVSARQLLDFLVKLGQDLPKAAFATLPPEAKRVFDQIPALLQQASLEAVKAGEQLPLQYQQRVLRVMEQGQRQSFATLTTIAREGAADQIGAIVAANDTLKERLRVVGTALVNEDGKRQQGIVDNHQKTLQIVKATAEDGSTAAKTFLTNVGNDYAANLLKMQGGFSTGIAGVDAQLALVHQKIVARQRETDAILAKTFRLTEDLTKGLQGPVLRFSEVLRDVTAAQIEYGNNYAVALDEVTLRAAKDYGLISQAALDMALATKRANAEAKDSNEEYGASVRKAREETDTYKASVNALSDATKALMALRIDIKTPFGTTINQLTDQLRQAQRDLLDLGTRIGDLGFAGYEQQRKVLQDLITELEKRIADLQKAQSTTATGTGTTGTGTGTGTTGTGTTGGGTTGSGASGGATGGGSGVSPASPTALQRPGVPLAPTGPPSGSLVIGGGTRPGGIPETTTQRSTTYNLVIQTQAQDAATLARDLVPYLRQADLSSRRLSSS